MATRAQEIDTIGDLLASMDVGRIYKQNFPTKYVANTVGIRWEGDNGDALTNARYSIDNTYQIVYFGSTLVDCLNKSEMISGVINDNLTQKIKIRNLDEYIMLRSFAMSKPFKTDTDEVYAVSAFLHVSSNRSRTQPVYQKMAEINTEIDRGGN